MRPGNIHGSSLRGGLGPEPGRLRPDQVDTDDQQADSAQSPVRPGTSDTADQIADGASENNYNCGGMQGINYSAPGVQAFTNSWADEFASWGVD
jgi:hypothetical protein